MKQNTAIEWLIEKWQQYQKDGEKFSWDQIIQITNLAKEKEEEQIKQAWVSGLNETPKGNAQNYFNQTYNNQ